jgi:hypothetical protein
MLAKMDGISEAMILSRGERSGEMLQREGAAGAIAAYICQKWAVGPEAALVLAALCITILQYY